MDKKTLSQSVSDFSKRLSRFNDSGKSEPVRPLSSDARLQQRITDMESERRERFLQQYNSLKRIVSPLCEKNEYISGSGFSFLRIWFLKNNESIEYVPLIGQSEDRRFLEFIPKEEYEFSRLEKEILQIIPE